MKDPNISDRGVGKGGTVGPEETATPLEGATPTKDPMDARQNDLLRNASEELASAEVELEELRRTAEQQGGKAARYFESSRREVERLITEARRLMSEIRSSRSDGEAPLVPALESAMDDVRRYVTELGRELEGASDRDK